MNVPKANIAFFAALVGLCLVIGACSDGTMKPNKPELEDSLVSILPSYLELVKYKVLVSENTGSKVDPIWKSRFQATIELSCHLYLAVSVNDNTGVTVVERASDKGMKLEFGGVTNSAWEGAWKHSTEIEGDKLSIGSTIGLWESRGKTIIRGSEEERVYIAKLKKAEEIFRLNLSNATTIVVGTWGDGDKNTLTCRADGTAHLVIDRFGIEFKGVWSIEPGFLVYRNTHRRLIRNSDDWYDLSVGSSGIVEQTSEQIYEIISIDNDNLSLKDTTRSDEHYRIGSIVYKRIMK